MTTGKAAICQNGSVCNISGLPLRTGNNAGALSAEIDGSGQLEANHNQNYYAVHWGVNGRKVAIWPRASVQALRTG